MRHLELVHERSCRPLTVAITIGASPCRHTTSRGTRHATTLGTVTQSVSLQERRQCPRVGSRNGVSCPFPLFIVFERWDQIDTKVIVLVFGVAPRLECFGQDLEFRDVFHCCDVVPEFTAAFMPMMRSLRGGTGTCGQTDASVDLTVASVIRVKQSYLTSELRIKTHVVYGKFHKRVSGYQMAEVYCALKHC